MTEQLDPLDPFSEVVNVQRRWMPDWYSWLTRTVDSIKFMVLSDSRTKMRSPSFMGPDPVQFYAATGLDVTWSGQGVGAGFRVETTIETTAEPDFTFGASGGSLWGGVRVRKLGLDPWGVVGCVYNDEGLANSEGAAVWGIMRGYCSTDAGNADAFRASSETVEGQPRAAYVAFNFLRDTAFKYGYWSTSSVGYGFLSGVNYSEGAIDAFDRIATPAKHLSFVQNSASVITLTIASPCVMSWTGHGLAIGDHFNLITEGTLPTGVAHATFYWVSAAGFTANSFQFSATPGGASVNTFGTQSGVHKAIAANEKFYVDRIGILKGNILTVGTLPAAGTVGRRTFVTDATATTFGSVAAGGGANGVPVYDDGINWRIG